MTAAQRTRRRGQRWAWGRGRGAVLPGRGPSAARERGTHRAQACSAVASGVSVGQAPQTQEALPGARVDTPAALPRPPPVAPAPCRVPSSPAGRARSCSSAVPGTDAACAEKLLGWAAPAQPCGAPPAAGTRPQRHSRAGPRHASRTRTGSAQQSGRKPGTAFPGRRTAPLRPTAGLRPSSSQRLPDYQSSGRFSLQQAHAAPRLRWGPGLGVCHLR